MTDYAELHAHSYYSLLDATSSPDSLMSQAAMLGMPAMALTDHDNLYGAVEFQKAGDLYGVKPIFGTELSLDTGHHLTVLVKNQQGWQNLCALITIARHNAPKGAALLPADQLAQYTGGLIALSGCRTGAIPAALLAGDWQAARDFTHHYVDLFGRDNFYLELQHHRQSGDTELVGTMIDFARQMRLHYVATNNIHYATPELRLLQDILVCIRHQCTLEDARHLLRSNGEFYLKQGVNLPFATEYPEAIAASLDIASQCQYRIPNRLQELPRFQVPDDMSGGKYLEYLCRQSPRCNSPKMEQQLTMELDIIHRAGLDDYFLHVWKIVERARKKGIRAQGRGSGGNSAVAYALGITPINPLAHGLVFERFLSDERGSAPDIDIDIDALRREEVIQDTYEQYTPVHVAMACTVVTFRHKSSLRDVGKALGLTVEMQDILLESWEQIQEEINAPLSNEHLRQILDLCQQLKGLPRHLGIHNGGMVLTADPLTHHMPTEPATMANRYVVQWDKYSLEESGKAKIDLLGLKMLSVISRATALAGVDVDNLTFDDPKIFAMISMADTIGIFQVESRAQAQMLPRFQPKNFADIIIAISLIRPGPIIGQMVHPYLRRRAGTEPVTYLHELLKPALEETLGVILFQEQCLKIAHDFAGFTYGQGETLRRALGSKNAAHLLDQLEDVFIQGAFSKGVDRLTVEKVFAQLRGFGSYSFSKAHAAAFAVIVYQSAWLRYYCPAAFYCSLLNCQPMGFWSPDTILHDGKRRGIKTLSVDIHRSEYECTLEEKSIRLGFTYVKGFGESAAESIVTARQSGKFVSLLDFCKRARLPKWLVENLIMGGAFGDLSGNKRNLIWDLGRLQYLDSELTPIFANQLSIPEEVPLPEMNSSEELEMVYEALGLSPYKQIMELYRDWLSRRHILSSRQLNRCQPEQRVKVAGLAVIRQAPPSANGVRFITLEDEFGFANIIVFPNVYKQYRQVIQQQAVLGVVGKVQREGRVINVVATSIHNLSTLVAAT